VSGPWRSGVGRLVRWAMAGATLQSSASGPTAMASCHAGGAPSRTEAYAATSATTAAASAVVGHIRRQTSAAVPASARSVCEAASHSSRCRRVTASRQSVRTMASPETSAWCGRKAMASATCRALVTASSHTVS
jgi:hypothetical protein